MKKFIQKHKTNLLASALVLGTNIVCYADSETPTSLLDASTTKIIKDFGADSKATTVEMIALVIPIGLGLWAVSFGVKKGLGYIQRRAQKAL